MRRCAVVLLLIGLLGACGGEDEQPLRSASEIVYQGTAKPLDPIPATVLQPGDLPVDVVATHWPRLPPSPFQTWECPMVGPATLGEGKPIRVLYDIGGDTVTSASYPDDSIWDSLFSEIEPAWEVCRDDAAKRGHPKATEMLDLGPTAIGFVSRRVDGSIEGEVAFALVGADLIGVTVMSYGGRDPSISVTDLLPKAIERARGGR